jgi:transglutaminase-like putative cysteine protease
VVCDIIKIRLVYRRIVGYPSSLSRQLLATFLYISSSVCLSYALPVSAGEIPTPTWGVMDRLEMGRDYLVDDPAAAASVVFDKGDIVVGPGYTFAFRRRCRMQIFSPAGYRYATTKIPYHRGEKIIGLEAHTITPDGRRVKVPKNRIYNIDNGRWRALVFAFPEVTPGCIVEYRYELQSRDFYYLRPWVFQTDIPTEHSQLVVHLPPGFEYAAVINGYNSVNSPIIDSYYSAEHHNARVKTFGWVAEHLPALRPLPYMASLEDHRTRLDFQIVSYRTKEADRRFIDSWPDLVDRVRSWYEELLDLSPEVEQFAENLASETTGRRKFAESAYRFCRDSIGFVAGSRTVSAEDLQPICRVLRERRGSAVEKNLLLVALLRWAGLNADPVLISTLDHLYFDVRDHRLDQLNHVIVRWAMPDDMVFLDASDPAGWFGLLPPSAIVDQGIWIGRDDGGIIDIPADDFEHSAQLQAEFNLTPDGNATGRLTGRLTGFRAWEWAGRAAPGDIESYLRSTLMPAATGLRVLELRAPSRVEDGAVEFALEIALQGAAMAGAGGLYFRSTGPFAHMDNPFVDPQRPFPVAFDFPYSDLVRITWRLPEGYTVAEIPRGGGKHTNDLDYTCGIVADGRTITVERRLNVGRRHFPRSAYGELQDFFGGIVDIDRSLAVGIKTAGQTTAAYSR